MQYSVSPLSQLFTWVQVYRTGIGTCKSRTRRRGSNFIRRLLMTNGTADVVLWSKGQRSRSSGLTKPRHEMLRLRRHRNSVCMKAVTQSALRVLAFWWTVACVMSSCHHKLHLPRAKVGPTKRWRHCCWSRYRTSPATCSSLYNGLLIQIVARCRPITCHLHVITRYINSIIIVPCEPFRLASLTDLTSWPTRDAVYRVSVICIKETLLPCFCRIFLCKSYFALVLSELISLAINLYGLVMTMMTMMGTNVTCHVMLTCHINSWN